MNLKEIGSRIKEKRQQQKLTQEQLAEMINVSPHYIYEIECGTKTMSLKTLNKIITSLDISADYILYGKFSSNDIATEQTSDSLSKLIYNLPLQKRNDIANIIHVLLPYLK